MKNNYKQIKKILNSVNGVSAVYKDGQYIVVAVYSNYVDRRGAYKALMEALEITEVDDKYSAEAKALIDFDYYRCKDGGHYMGWLDPSWRIESPGIMTKFGYLKYIKEPGCAVYFKLITDLEEYTRKKKNVA